MEKKLKPYYDNARALHLPVAYIPEIAGMYIPLGKKNYFFAGGTTCFNNNSAINLIKSKQACQDILRKANLPVPKSTQISKTMFQKIALEELLQDLRFPLVAKPEYGTSSGEGVICSIKDKNSLAYYLELSFERYEVMQIEEFQQGLREYRVLVFQNKILAVVERYPLSIIGDGLHSIKQLFTEIAQHQSPEYAPFKIDQECLNDQCLNQESIPEQGKVIRLSYPVNHAVGGTVRALSEKIPASNQKAIKKIAQTLSLDLTGIDIMCEDICKPFEQTRWLILEANFGPDITLHEYPEQGNKIAVSKCILKQLIWRHPLAYLKHRLRTVFHPPAQEEHYE